MIVLVLGTVSALWLAAAPGESRCVGIGRHDPAALRSICDAERDWSRSVANGDTGVPNRILADDYVGIGSNGERYDKAQMAAQPTRTSRFVASEEQEEAQVRFYGDVAVSQGKDTMRTRDGHVSQVVWTDTWLRRSGKWQIIASQDVVLPASSR